MVASHPKVLSFPETHFFSDTLPINPLLRRLMLHGRRSRRVVLRFLEENGYGELQPFRGRSPFKFYTYRGWCRTLIDIIDRMIVREARKNRMNGTIWGLEKTPRHLHYISSIEETGPASKFLHILRSGPDVVASLYLATNQYPEQWGGKRSIKKCIRWWNDSLRESLKYRRKSNHILVTYEQLIEDPETVLRAICGFLELDFSKEMLQRYHTTADALTREEEKWKDQNRSKSLNKSQKLNAHFDPDTVRYIREQVLPVNLKDFYH